MKCLTNIDRAIIPTDMLLNMMHLYKYSGKDPYYNTLFKGDAQAFKRITAGKETINFARVMGLKLTDQRLALLANKDLVPKNKDEKIAINLKQLFNNIINKISDFDLIPNQILGFAEWIYHDVYKIKFKTEVIQVKNRFISDKTKKSLADDLKELLDKLSKMEKSKTYEITSLIVCFFFDFYMLKPFEEIEGEHVNEVVSYLMLYTLLFKFEFDVFNYESYFEKFYENMKNFQYQLKEGIHSYDEGFAQTSNVHRIVISMCLSLYDSLEKKLPSYTSGKDLKLSKGDDVWTYIQKLSVDTFKKSDIQRQYPTTSAKTIERVLAKLQADGIIESQGTGRSAFWIKKKEKMAGYEYEPLQFNFLDTDEE